MADRQYFVGGVQVFETEDLREYFVNGVQINESLEGAPPEPGSALPAIAHHYRQLMTA